jgi:hypothetical protein
MATEKDNTVNQSRRNIAITSVALVGMGSVGGMSFLSGKLLAVQKRKELVEPFTQQLVNGIIKGETEQVIGALNKAKKYGVLNEVVEHMVAGQTVAKSLDDVNETLSESEVETRVRFSLKNFRSAVDLRKPEVVHRVLCDARSEQVLEPLVNELVSTLVRQKAL